MKFQEHMILLLMEECAEISEACGKIGVRASKILRFGANEVQAGQLQDNTQRLIAELADLAGTLEYLADVGIINREQIDAKKSKISKFLDLSRSLGTVEGECEAG